MITFLKLNNNHNIEINESHVQYCTVSTIYTPDT